VSKLLSLDRATVLTAFTAFGMLLGVLALWPLQGDIASLASLAGLSVVYLAGGLPATWRAIGTLWEEHVLDIDLLMVVAAVAAAVVGAPFEGAILLTLFSVSTTLEERALGRARRAIEALMALRPETALRKVRDGAVKEIPAGHPQQPRGIWYFVIHWACRDLEAGQWISGLFSGFRSTLND
jgi:Cd2+/Zn2+-exporting ATPase